MISPPPSSDDESEDSIFEPPLSSPVPLFEPKPPYENENNLDTNVFYQWLYHNKNIPDYSYNLPMAIDVLDGFTRVMDSCSFSNLVIEANCNVIVNLLKDTKINKVQRQKILAIIRRTFDKPMNTNCEHSLEDLKRTVLREK
ncbi:MAG: hypothetical protein VX777_06360 [Chlamydiota bacterium]|nr:hypothetical protein [Chlamydiota bacterium]